MVNGQVSQSTKIYIIIAHEDELSVKLKSELGQKEQVEVYFLSPRFFLQPEFVHNPLWFKAINRIIWVLQSKQEVSEIVAICSFLKLWQEKLVVLGLDYSPPPEISNIKKRRSLNSWRQKTNNDNDVRTRIMLSLPRASLVIGQDVLLDSMTGESPISEIINFTVKNNLPDFDGLSFYWQTLNEFWVAAEEKLFNPLIGMRFWLCGKKTSGNKFQSVLGGFFEELTGNSWHVEKRDFDKNLPVNRLEKTMFFAQQVFVQQEVNNVDVLAKWELYLKLILKNNNIQSLQQISEEKVEKKNNEVVQEKRFFVESDNKSLFPSLVQNDQKKVLFKSLVTEKREFGELKTVSESSMTRIETILANENEFLQAKIRPLGMSLNVNGRKDPEEMMVKVRGKQKEREMVFLSENNRSDYNVKTLKKVSLTQGKTPENDVGQKLSNFLPVDQVVINSDLVKKSDVKGKSRLVEKRAEVVKIEKKKEVISLPPKEVEKRNKKKIVGSAEQVVEKRHLDKKVVIEKEELKKETKKSLIEKPKQQDVIKKKASSSPPLKKVKKNKEKLVLRRFLGVVFLFFAVLFLGSMALLLNWQNSEKKYYSQVAQMLRNCSSVSPCDWKEENEVVQRNSISFATQLSLYQRFLPLTKQTDYDNWEKVVLQMGKYQDNKIFLANNWEMVYLGLVGRSKNSGMTELWQNQENLIWQNDQLISTLSTMLDKIEGNEWFDEQILAQIRVQLKDEKAKNNQLYQQVGFWRQAFGQKGRKNYMILLSNSALLRPNGGVLESVLDVEIIDGQINKIVPYSVAEIEAKIVGKPIINTKLAGYLGLKNGSLAELGMDADFEVMANKAVWYFQRSLNKEIDGIIQVNSDLIAREVKSLDEVVLLKGQTRVSRNNYEQILKDHSQMKVSDEKRIDFFVDILTSLVQKKMLVAKDLLSNSMEVINEGLERGEINIWLAKTENEDKAKQLGWSGFVQTPDCHQLFGTMNCTSDGILYYLADISDVIATEHPKMDWQEEVLVDKESILRKSKLNLEISQTQIGNKYYIQFYLPQKATEVNFLVDGVQVLLDAENGVLVDFGTKKKKVVEISYKLDKPRIEESTSSPPSTGYIYTYFQNQPVGFHGIKSNLKLTNNTEAAFKIISPSVIQEGKSLNFSSVAEEDLFITVGF